MILVTIILVIVSIPTTRALATTVTPVLLAIFVPRGPVNLVLVNNVTTTTCVRMILAMSMVHACTPIIMELARIAMPVLLVICAVVVYVYPVLLSLATMTTCVRTIVVIVTLVLAYTPIITPHAILETPVPREILVMKDIAFLDRL
jgi:hypothetical protein